MLTPEEQQIIEYGKQAGKTPQEALVALSNYRDEQAQTKQPEVGFGEDLLGDIKGIGTGIKESLTSRGTKLGEILQADAKGEQGKASSIFQASTNFAGAVTDVFGQVIKGGVKSVLSQNKENQIKLAVEKVGKKIMELPETKQFIQNYQDLQKESPEYARNVVALAEGGEFLLNFAGLKMGKDIVGTGIKTAVGGIKSGVGTTKTAVGGAIQSGRQTLQPTVNQVQQVISNTRKFVTPIAKEASRIPSRVSTNLAEKQAVEQSIKSLPSKLAQVAARDGVDVSDIRTLVSSSTKGNKPLIKELATTTKNFASGTTKTNPIEVVGKPIVS